MAAVPLPPSLQLHVYPGLQTGFWLSCFVSIPIPTRFLLPRNTLGSFVLTIIIICALPEPHSITLPRTFLPSLLRDAERLPSVECDNSILRFLFSLDNSHTDSDSFSSAYFARRSSPWIVCVSVKVGIGCQSLVSVVVSTVPSMSTGCFVPARRTIA